MQNKIMDNDIIFGKKAITESLKHKTRINKVLLADSLHRDNQLNLILDQLRKSKVPFSWVPRKKLDSITKGAKHQGIVAYTTPIQFHELEDLLSQAKSKQEAPFLLILDSVQDPHNLGALARTAEAAGIHGIIIPKHRASPITPTVVKASAGAIEHIMIHRCTNINRTIEQLKKTGIWIIGTDDSAQENHYSADLTGPIAVVLGSEGKGISQKVSEKCDFLVKIPMRGKVSSLNVSAAGAIIIYEALRQRDVR